MQKKNPRMILLMIMFTVLFVGCGLDTTDQLVVPDENLQPEHPLNVTASDGKHVTVSWDTTDGLCYNLYWNTLGGVTVFDSAVQNVQSPYEHTGLITNGTEYYYAATTVDCLLLSESALSGEVSAISNYPSSEHIILAASDSEMGDDMGYSVSIDGDYAVTGAPFEDGEVALSNSGAAYVYYRAQDGAGNWGQVAKLIASDAEAYDELGWSVAISGDNIIVGAVHEDGAGMDRGSAYIFNRNQGGTDNWGQVAKLTALDTEDSDVFGVSVSINGDFAIVGATGEDGASGTSLGAAYVFNRNQGGTDNWGQVKKLTSLVQKNQDRFGGSVAISEESAIVGNYMNVAYVFNRDQGGMDNWGQVKALAISGAELGDRFGWTVSLDGDDIVISAPFIDNNGLFQGAVYIFNRNQGGADNWGEVIKLTSTDIADNDTFGSAASIRGDYVIAGAAGDDDNGDRSGSAYVFYRNHGGANNWGQVSKLTPTDGKANDMFGVAVSISNGDAIVGTYQDNGLHTAPGAAYIY